MSDAPETVREDRPCRRLIILTILVTVVVLGVGSLIGWSDKPLACTCTPSSAALEWISDPATARQIVGDWEKWVDSDQCKLGKKTFTDFTATSVVRRGILIDFLFIVVYVLGLRYLIRACGRAIPVDRRWGMVAKSLSRFMIVAGALDVIENIGILLEMYGHLFWLAPLVALVAIAKWVLVVIGILFILLSIAYCLRIHTRRKQHGIDERAERRLLLEFNRV